MMTMQCSKRRGPGAARALPALLALLGGLALLGCPPGDQLVQEQPEEKETFRILGLWREGSGDYEVTFDQPWPPSPSGRGGEGLDPERAAKRQLVEIETYLKGGSRNYAAVWKAVEGASVVEHDLSFRELEGLANRREDGVGLRLVDVECYGEDGGVRYLGLWRPASGRVRVERGLSYEDLGARRELAGYGALEEVELCPTAKDGGTEYLALWAEGGGESLLKDIAEWDDAADGPALDGTVHDHDEFADFAAMKRYEHWLHNLDRSLRLADAELDGDTPRVGLWRTGAGCDWLWLGESWEQLLAQPGNDPAEAADHRDEEACEPLPPLELVDLEVVRIVTPAGMTPSHPAHGGHGSGGPEGG